MQENNVKVHSELSIPLGSLCWIAWVVFMIMDYGCHMDWIINANNAVKAGGHFWTWFPFWLPFALFGVLLIFSAIIFVIAIAVDNN